MTALAAERRAQRATGASILIFFGTAWIIGGLLLLKQPYPTLVLVGVVAVACFLWALRIRERVQQQAGTPAPKTLDEQRRQRWFNIVNAGQWVLILILANILNNIGLGRWVLPMAIGVVGLHFLPLAPLFRVRSHYVTGAALILVAVVIPLLAPAGPESGFGPLLTGVVLWASAAWALRVAQG